MIHVSAGKWASFCLMWKASNGLRLFVNGIELQLTAPSSTFWFRNYTAPACRLTVCHYTSDLAIMSRCRLRHRRDAFSNLFYSLMSHSLTCCCLISVSPCNLFSIALEFCAINQCNVLIRRPASRSRPYSLVR